MTIISADTPFLSTTEMDIIGIMRQIHENKDVINLDHPENEPLISREIYLLNF